jgi:hypothetical protein
MYYVIRQESDNQAHWHSMPTGATFGQSFTANAPVITEVWFNIAGDNVTARIRAGGPTGAIIATSSTVPVVDFGWTKIVFATPVNVTTGAPLYLEGVASGTTWAWFSNLNDYGAGDGFLGTTPHGHDLNARVIGRTS